MIAADEDRFVISKTAMKALWEAEALLEFSTALMGNAAVIKGPVMVEAHVLERFIGTLQDKLADVWGDAELFTGAELPLPRPPVQKSQNRAKAP